MSLRAQSRTMFPNWSRRQRARWVRAKLIAARCAPHYARLLPLTAEAIPQRQHEFAARTLREALQ